MQQMPYSAFIQVNNNKKWFKLVGGAVLSDNQFYNIVITQDAGRPFTESFVATATAVVGGIQDRDEFCNTLSINGSGQRTAKNKKGNDNNDGFDRTFFFFGRYSTPLF